jgi:hypothetical protein
MSKGFDWSVSLLMAVILGIVAAGVAFAAISFKAPPVKAEVTQPTQGCNSNADCANNIDGRKCMTVYPGSFEPFCGCMFDNECATGVCSSNNKCIVI